MAKSKTLGEVLKLRRDSMELTQRQLAAKLGVKASHVAYLENGRRRPSLSLVRRLADVLGLKRESLFLLAYPEARELLSERTRAQSAKPRAEDAWRSFVRDRATLARHKVKPSELRVLKQVSELGHVSNPRQFLFVLNSIRQALEEGPF